MPQGWADPTKENCLFPTALKTFKADGVGYSNQAVRGKNWLGSVVRTTLNRFCNIQGKFSNHQLRAAMITGLLEAGDL